MTKPNIKIERFRNHALYLRLKSRLPAQTMRSIDRQIIAISRQFPSISLAAVIRAAYKRSGSPTSGQKGERRAPKGGRVTNKTRALERQREQQEDSGEE